MVPVAVNPKSLCSWLVVHSWACLAPRPDHTFSKFDPEVSETPFSGDHWRRNDPLSIGCVLARGETETVKERTSPFATLISESWFVGKIRGQNLR